MMHLLVSGLATTLHPVREEEWQWPHIAKVLHCIARPRFRRG